MAKRTFFIYDHSVWPQHFGDPRRMSELPSS